LGDKCFDPKYLLLTLVYIWHIVADGMYQTSTQSRLIFKHLTHLDWRLVSWHRSSWCQVSDASWQLVLCWQRVTSDKSHWAQYCWLYGGWSVTFQTYVTSHMSSWQYGAQCFPSLWTPKNIWSWLSS